MTNEETIQRLYTTGMQFAGMLRLVGRHEEAHEMELWVLALQAELNKANK
jgi:hypothetical protein